MSRRLQPDAGYRVFLDLLVQTRTDQGVSLEELAERLELLPAQVAAFESGEKPLHFVQTREWCQALGVTFLDSMINLDREVTAQLPAASALDADQTEGGDQ
jgi:transcriptional regulator with XRE-family HTH domain